MGERSGEEQLAEKEGRKSFREGVKRKESKNK